MNCNVCHKRTDGGPVVAVYVVYDDSRHREPRFTGIAWHADCAPAEKEHLHSECRAIARAQGTSHE